jgi:potassium efflux system protein
MIRHQTLRIDRMIMQNPRGKVGIFVIFILLSLGCVNISPAAAAPQAKTAEPATEPAEKPKTTFTQLYSWANILPKELIDLQSRIHNDQRIESVKEDLPKLAAEVDGLRKQADVIVQEDSANVLELNNQLNNQQGKIDRIDIRLNKYGQTINDVIEALSATRSLWNDRLQNIKNYEKTDHLTQVLAKDQRQMLSKTVEEANDIIEAELRSALEIGKSLGDLQVRIYSIESDLKNFEKKLESKSIEQTSPSILSPQLYKSISPRLIVDNLRKSGEVMVAQVKSMHDKRHLAFLYAVGVLLCYLFVKNSGKLAPGNSRWITFASSPWWTTIFLTTSNYALLNFVAFDFGVPSQLETLLYILTQMALIGLTKKLLEKSWWRTMLIRLTGYLMVVLLLILTNMPQVIILLYITFTSIALLIWYFVKLPKIQKSDDFARRLRWMVGVLPGIILIAGIGGYDQFAVMAFSVLLGAIISSLIVWMLFQLIIAFLELACYAMPISLVKTNWQQIVATLQPIVVGLHILLFLAIQGVVWSLYATVNESLKALVNFGFSFGSTHFTVGFFLSVTLIVYGAILLSRALQKILLDKVLPRYGASKGVQLSIARLAHYTILTIAFIVMLRILGVEPTQITLIGGALGVGIGFGLQAIVNNFASGLILLFERPIKVGDTIQVGTDFGEVKNMGLRATIIQTFDNAEIVVPNSDLVTGQVINWTLADRKVRVRVPVGVAYGSDVAKVIKILLDCAHRNPMVLSTPAPIAYFLAFGSSSLDFELRVWIPEFLEKIQVLSDLNQDIESEFDMNGIEIPFPQTDLHVRSIDESIAPRFAGRTEGPAPSRANQNDVTGRPLANELDNSVQKP